MKVSAFWLILDDWKNEKTNEILKNEKMNNWNFPTNDKMKTWHDFEVKLLVGKKKAYYMFLLSFPKEQSI